MEIIISLIEYLSMRLGCMYLSDLRSLCFSDRLRAYHILEEIPPECETLKNWNDALDYLVNESPAETCEAAREKLMAALVR